jgi:hypothetical protein
LHIFVQALDSKKYQIINSKEDRYNHTEKLGAPSDRHHRMGTLCFVLLESVNSPILEDA